MVGTCQQGLGPGGGMGEVGQARVGRRVEESFSSMLTLDSGGPGAGS